MDDGVADGTSPTINSPPSTLTKCSCSFHERDVADITLRRPVATGVTGMACCRRVCKVGVLSTTRCRGTLFGGIDYSRTVILLQQ